MFNKELLKKYMDRHGDQNKDLAAYLGMSAPNFSTIWNGRQQINVKHIRMIAIRYSVDLQLEWEIFRIPDGKRQER